MRSNGVPATVLTVVALLASVDGSAAQALQADPLTVEGELGASLFFGNTEQTLVTSRLGVDRAGDRWGYTGGANFSFGQATDDSGASFVNKRSWSVAVSADYLGFGRVSPTLSGRVASSLEKRIDLRVAVGVGASLAALRRERTRLDAGISLQAEHTEPRVADDGSQPDGETLARWSGRVRFRQELSEGRVVFTSDTNFHPRFSTFDNLTFTSENAFAFQLTEVVSLKFTFIDSYDSEAKSRGAETNNDGQLVFSVLSSF